MNCRADGATSVRLVAGDHRSEALGWIAFTHRYRTWSTWAPTAYQHLQVYPTIAPALTLRSGPGLPPLRRETPAEFRPVWLLAADPLTLAAIGAVLWIAGGTTSPQVLEPACVTALWIALGVAGALVGP